MDDFDFDVSLLKSESTNGVFLTKVELTEDVKIKATYYDFENGVVKDKIVETYDNIHKNHQDINKFKYATVMKIIEINDKDLYKKIDDILDKMLNYHKTYVFTNITSLLSAFGSLALGYIIVNNINNDNYLKIALISSLGILFMGVCLRVQYIKSKNQFDNDAETVRESVLTSAEKYSRVRRKVEEI